jgi:regulator of replication initiation timing
MSEWPEKDCPKCDEYASKGLVTIIELNEKVSKLQAENEGLESECTNLAHKMASMQAENAKLREALEWLTNVACGVSKSGGVPSDSEITDAIESAKAALKGEK